MTAAAQLEVTLRPVIGVAALLLLLVRGLRGIRDQPAGAGLGGTWWLLAGVALLAFRWPLLFVPHQLNPDETQLIAGALTLRHDPLFWRSLDGNTGGPFAYYPLLPGALVSGFPSYVVARLTALVLTWATLLLAGETIALLAGAALARVVLLPALAAAAFTTCPDFLFYGTETMPALLLAAAAYAAVRQGLAPAPRWLWTTALLLGCVPWGKLQATPIAAVLWLLVVVRESRAGRASSRLPLLLGGLLPTLACLGVATGTGQFEHLYLPYILQNVAYVADPHFSWLGNAREQGLNAFSDGYLGFWLTGGAVLLVLAGWFVRSAPVPRRRIALAALLLFAAALYSALAPRRPSAHHLQFLFAPWVGLTGAALALGWADAARRRWLGLGFLACTLLPLVAWRVGGHDAYAQINADVPRPARRQLSELIDRFSRPGEPLAVWGWRCSLYVEAGRPQATRQAHTEPQLRPGPLQGYYLRRYLEDFRASNPPVFADAVGPNGFAFTDRDRAHECFPPLRDWVRAHYTQIADLDGTRLYVRNDRLAAAGITPP